MTERSERTAWTWLVIAALAIGAALRLWRIGGIPLWLDEAYSAFAAAHGFGFIWRIVPFYETHPPFYYSLLRVWTLAFGDSLVVLRALGLTAGFATLAALALMAREAAGWLGWDGLHRRRLTGALVALGCVSIPLVEMSREVRPYPLMIFAYALALAVVLRIARRRDGGVPVAGPAYAVYLALVAALLWLHNLGPLWAAALGLALAAGVAARADRSDWQWLIGGHVLLVLIDLPALIMMRQQAAGWMDATWLRFAFAATPPHLAVLYAVPGWQAIAAAALASLGGVALWRLEKRLLAMLLLAALVPTALSLALSATIAPVFITRTLTPVAVPTLLLLSIGIVAWPRPIAWLGAGAALILGANLLAVGVQTRAAGAPQNWYGALAWLGPRWRSGDLILAYPNEGALPLRRALRDRGLDWPVRPVPGEVPSLGIAGARHPTGSPGVPVLPQPLLHAIAGDPELARVPTIWLMRLGASTYDPGDTFFAELHRRRYIVRHFADDPIDIVGLRLKPAPAPGRSRR